MIYGIHLPIGLITLGDADNISRVYVSHILMVDSVFQHRTIASTQCYTSIRKQKHTRIQHRAIVNKAIINTRHHRLIAAGRQTAHKGKLGIQKSPHAAQ
jgi:hypothetical protein